MATSPPDITQLTATQQEALQTYTSVTDQEPLAAISLLQRTEWNVQIAIARFFDGEPTTDPLEEARAALPPISTRQTSNLQYDSLLAAARPRSPRREPADLVQRVDATSTGDEPYRPSFLLSALLTPLNIIYRVFSTVLSPFSFLVPSFISRMFTRLLYQQSRPTRRPLPPSDTARRFIREFSEDHGSNTLPFSENGFNLSLETANKESKFLLVVLLSPSHDQTHDWVQSTLLSSQFRDFLQTHSSDVTLWGGNVQDPESYQVSTSLTCTKFPFVALVCNTSDGSRSAMSVVVRAVGPTTPNELVAKLGAAVTANQAHLRSQRSQRAEQQASTRLREEQDSAYERSLAADRERARRRREEAEEQSRGEKEALARAEAEENRKAKALQWRRWRAQSVGDEPAASGKDVVRISIRMPNGERVIRKFSGDAELEELYAFVECHDILEDAASSGPTRISELEKVDRPNDYEHVYNFRLVSPMPRTVYDLKDPGSIGGKIGRSGNLIVEPIEEEEGEAGEAG